MLHNLWMTCFTWVSSSYFITIKPLKDKFSTPIHKNNSNYMMIVNISLHDQYMQRGVELGEVLDPKL